MKAWIIGPGKILIDHALPSGSYPGIMRRIIPVENPLGKRVSQISGMKFVAVAMQSLSHNSRTSRELEPPHSPNACIFKGTAKQDAQKACKEDPQCK